MTRINLIEEIKIKMERLRGYWIYDMECKGNSITKLQDFTFRLHPNWIFSILHEEKFDDCQWYGVHSDSIVDAVKQAEQIREKNPHFNIENIVKLGTKVECYR
jgi:hypothetical protein